MGSTKKWSAAVAIVLCSIASSIAAAGTITYYHNDLLGSPVAATNAAGQVIWRESYRPYGERIKNEAGSAENKVWYTSRRQDGETGLVYMGARYYDPIVGRFMGVDPKAFDESNIHSFNRYTYANNNPYKYTDPDGRVVQSVVIVGTAVVVVGGAVYIGSSSDNRKRMEQSFQAGMRSLHNIFSENESSGGPSEAGPRSPDPKSGSELDPADKGGELTKAGRAQQKHGDRAGSAFDPAKGTPADKNQQGQKSVDDILNSPDRVDKVRGGGTEVWESPGGKGADFDRNGSFQGFLEPKR